MLSNTARNEILRKLGLAAGFKVREELLSPSTKQAITNLAAVQKNLSIIGEVLEAENSRLRRSRTLRAARHLGRDSERAEKERLKKELVLLQKEVDDKVVALSKQIIAEENARQALLPPPEYKGEVVLKQLSCPKCGAPLGLPTGAVVECKYCGSTYATRELSPQMKAIIRSI